MKQVSLVFPHQLFRNHPAIQSDRPVYLIEEFLFFRQYNFHKQKIAFHRASMRFYKSHLEKKKIKVFYIDAMDELSDIRKLISYLQQNGVEKINFVEPADDWLEKRIRKSADALKVKVVEYGSPMFLNSTDELKEYFDRNSLPVQTNFYMQERKRRKILLDKQGKPVGGKWTYDSENRLKYPKDKEAPEISFPPTNSFYREALTYTDQHFGSNPGSCDLSFRYPTTFKESSDWLQHFLENRFSEFGPYEDAIVRKEQILHHSLLSPVLNVGLLTPNEVVNKSLEYYGQNNIPLNSCEGFIRQVIGWREYIRGIYIFKGVMQRTRNFWGFTRKIPDSFYSGDTGIDPLDEVIRKVLKTGYCHHIERLMILGNFMLLCEFDPDEVYRWFMELFIDAYDWVMVPNVYGMSQFADGGLMATKPYISGSNYIFKMSDYPKGEWQKIWDGLFWRFMHVHREFFEQNPRLGMLIRTFDKMDLQKQKTHLKNAEKFLKNLAV